jgi:hypothetical protein
MAVKSFIVQASGANPLKLFNIVICCYTKVPFCVIKQYKMWQIPTNGNKLPG